MEEIEINGRAYVPKEGASWPETTRAVVVVDRGWIYAGDVEDVTTEDGRHRIRIHNAVWVFRWEKVGFSGVLADPSKADLRPQEYPVDLPGGAEIFRVPVPSDWGRR